MGLTPVLGAAPYRKREPLNQIKNISMLPVFYARNEIFFLHFTKNARIRETDRKDIINTF